MKKTNFGENSKGAEAPLAPLAPPSMKNKNFFKTDICQEKNVKISINACGDKKN